jgi:hypothetical protein
MATAPRRADPHQTNEPQRPIAESKTTLPLPHGPRAELWAYLAARACNACVRSSRFENDHERTTGDAQSGRDDLHTLASLAVSRERHDRAHRRSRVWPPRPTLTHRLLPLDNDHERTARAKPCLAGRPTAFVRTQRFEQNTSRGRPSGMELPDYPVVALTPTPQDQDGPVPQLPAGSFPGFVARYASRPVFSCIRTSFRFL